MIKTLYLAIEQQLMAIKKQPMEIEDPEIIVKGGQPLPSFFKHFDLWNQQVEFLEQETPFNTPAVFVEFDPINWHTTGKNIQEAEITVKLHIVTPWYANTPANTPQAQRTQALEYLTIPSLVVAAMHGLVIAPPNDSVIGYSNTWTREQSIVNHNHEHYVDSVEVYKTHVYDRSAELKYSTHRIVTYEIEEGKPLP